MAETGLRDLQEFVLFFSHIARSPRGIKGGLEVVIVEEEL